MSSSFTDYADRYIDCVDKILVNESLLNNASQLMKDPERIVPVENVILRFIIKLQTQESSYITWELGSVELVSILAFSPISDEDYTSFLFVPNLICRVSSDKHVIQIFSNEENLRLNGIVTLKINYRRHGY